MPEQKQKKQRFQGFREALDRESKRYSVMEIFAYSGAGGAFYALLSQLLSFSPKKKDDPLPKWPGLIGWRKMTQGERDKYQQKLFKKDMSEGNPPLGSGDFFADGVEELRIQRENAPNIERDFTKGAKDVLVMFAAYAAGVMFLKWLFPLRKEEENSLPELKELPHKTSSQLQQSEAPRIPEASITYRSDWRETTVKESEQETVTSLGQG